MTATKENAWDNLFAIDEATRTATITLLLHAEEDKWGFEHEHYGKLWKSNKDDLFRVIRFIFGVKKVVVAEQRLSY